MNTKLFIGTFGLVLSVFLSGYGKASYNIGNEDLRQLAQRQNVDMGLFDEILGSGLQTNSQIAELFNIKIPSIQDMQNANPSNMSEDEMMRLAMEASLRDTQNTGQPNMSEEEMLDFAIQMSLQAPQNNYDEDFQTDRRRKDDNMNDLERILEESRFTARMEEIARKNK